MSTYVKSTFAIFSALLFVSALYFIFGFDIKNNTSKQAPIKQVLSSNDILNSKRVQTNTDEIHNKTQSKTNRTNNNEEQTSDGNNSVINIYKSEQSKNTKPADKQQHQSKENKKNDESLDWVFDAILSGAKEQELDNKGSSNSFYTDDNLFLNYSESDYYATSSAQKDNPNNEKYAQEKLYVNILAAVLMKYQYENNTPEAVEKFNSWFTNKNPEGKEQVIKEANDYLRIAEVLQNTSGIPDSFKGINDRMARAYKVAGEKMLLLTKDMSDDEKMQVLESYTKAANDVTKAYIAISDMIDILGISFDNDEPGKLFVFPGSKVPWNEN